MVIYIVVMYHLELAYLTDLQSPYSILDINPSSYLLLTSSPHLHRAKMKFTTLFSIAITTASIAAPASAGFLPPLVNQMVAIFEHVPCIVNGLNIVGKFQACAVCALHLYSGTTVYLESAS